MFFGNPGYFDIGDQAALGPSLAFQTHTDGFSTRANRRMDPAYQFDESFAWFVPGKKGDHDLKFGASIVHTPLHIYDASTLNGTFGFSATDLDFDRNNPRTYPDRLTIRVPAPSDFIVTGTYYGVFAQDKWKINNRLTASVGVRWDAEILPIEEKDNPKFASPDDYPKDMNNFAPRLGLTWALDEAGHVGDPRRLGPVLPEDAVRVPDRRRVVGRVSRIRSRCSFPANNIDPGPSQGRLPTDPFLVNGPVVNRALLNSDVPGRHAAEEHRHGAVRQSRIARCRTRARPASATSGSSAPPMAASVDYIRNDLKELYLRQDLNPGTARHARRARRR